MKETLDIKEPTMATSVVNYTLNRFMPFICTAGLLLYSCGYDSLIPYAVLGFMWFASRFSFGCGFASALLQSELNMAHVVFSSTEVEESEDETLNSEDKKLK